MSPRSQTANRKRVKFDLTSQTLTDPILFIPGRISTLFFESAIFCTSILYSLMRSSSVDAEFAILRPEVLLVAFITFFIRDFHFMCSVISKHAFAPRRRYKASI